MKAIDNLEVSIKSLSAYPIEKNVIKDMQAKLAQIRTEIYDDVINLIKKYLSILGNVPPDARAYDLLNYLMWDIEKLKKR